MMLSREPCYVLFLLRTALLSFALLALAPVVHFGADKIFY